MKLYTVLLKYPDAYGSSMDGRTPTTLRHVSALSSTNAVTAAQRKVAADNSYRFASSEFEPLLVIEGHHESLV